MTDVETPASRGWIFCENNSAVSQAGWLDGFHDERALAWRRCEPACLAKASGVCAAARPSRAASASRSVAPSIEHCAHYMRPAVMFLPHPRQSVCGPGVGGAGQGGAPLACRLLPWVSLVANRASGLRMVDQKARATHSAIGATARPQIGAVFES